MQYISKVLLHIIKTPFLNLEIKAAVNVKQGQKQEKRHNMHRPGTLTTVVIKRQYQRPLAIQYLTVGTVAVSA